MSEIEKSLFHYLNRQENNDERTPNVIPRVEAIR
jgi:hypothetical protein